MQLAWDNERLIGVIGVTKPAGNACWIRLVVLTDSNHAEARRTFNLLWREVARQVKTLVNNIAVLIIEQWLLTLIKPLGFQYREDIVTLRRGAERPPEVKVGFQIRQATGSDLALLQAVDRAAFDPLWQMTLHDLRNAQRIASACTVAIDSQSQVLGYQLSTQYHRNGHLARLAVLPSNQGRGVGAGLLTDLIWRFLRRNTQTITVNTQSRNQTSQRLYQRFGFRHNGYNLQVWMIDLNTDG